MHLNSQASRLPNEDKLVPHLTLNRFGCLINCDEWELVQSQCPAGGEATRCPLLAAHRHNSTAWKRFLAASFPNPPPKKKM